MKQDFILIHGFYLKEDGELDPVLIARLDHALLIYKNCMGKIIVAGNHGVKDKEIVEKTGVTESAKMKEYLVKKGIPSEEVTEEPGGKNTWDCSVNAFNNIILPKKWTSGHIISSSEHLPRVQLQTNKILSLLNVEPNSIMLFYSGPQVTDLMSKKLVLEYEDEAIRFTLDYKNNSIDNKNV